MPYAPPRPLLVGHGVGEDRGEKNRAGHLLLLTWQTLQKIADESGLRLLHPDLVIDNNRFPLPEFNRLLRSHFYSVLDYFGNRRLVSCCGNQHLSLPAYLPVCRQDRPRGPLDRPRGAGVMRLKEAC